MLQQVKVNLSKSQERMKYYADKKRTERILEVGDMRYLKMQTYSQNTFELRGPLKLRAKYYGPFKVV